MYEHTIRTLNKNKEINTIVLILNQPNISLLDIVDEDKKVVLYKRKRVS